MKYITVYCSSSNSVASVYFDAANELGKALVKENFNLVYGGADVGLMGAIAHTVKKEGGKVISVILDLFNDGGLSFKESDDLIITSTMSERKKQMMKIGSGLIALPGGYGTLEEFTEAITQKILKKHNKPLILLNINGFYDELLIFFEKLMETKFANKRCSELYYVANNVEEARKYLLNYKEFKMSEKWLATNKYKE